MTVVRDHNDGALRLVVGREGPATIGRRSRLIHREEGEDLGAAYDTPS